VTSLQEATNASVAAIATTRPVLNADMKVREKEEIEAVIQRNLDHCVFVTIALRTT
jgi:hypothetical protein